MSDPTSPSPSTDGIEHPRSSADSNGHSRTDSSGGIIRRSWVAMTDMLTPFSPAALASLPKNLKRSPKYTRADRIPETDANDEGNLPAVRDYHAINSLPPQVRVPKKIATPIKVEAKVWLANERSTCFLRPLEVKERGREGLTILVLQRTCLFLAWVSYLNVGVLIGTLALALFNSSKDEVARNFAYFYAVVSVGILVSRSVCLSCYVGPTGLLGLWLDRVPAPHQHDSQAGSWSLWLVPRLLTPCLATNSLPLLHVDQLVGLVVISALLFFAILANFVIRGQL